MDSWAPPVRLKIRTAHLESCSGTTNCHNVQKCRRESSPHLISFCPCYAGTTLLADLHLAVPLSNWQMQNRPQPWISGLINHTQDKPCSHLAPLGQACSSLLVGRLPHLFALALRPLLHAQTLCKWGRYFGQKVTSMDKKCHMKFDIFPAVCNEVMWSYTGSNYLTSNTAVTIIRNHSHTPVKDSNGWFYGNSIVTSMKTSQKSETQDM